jgi:hypothetical protein
MQEILKRISMLEADYYGPIEEESEKKPDEEESEKEPDEEESEEAIKEE